MDYMKFKNLKIFFSTIKKKDRIMKQQTKTSIDIEKTILTRNGQIEASIRVLIPTHKLENCESREILKKFQNTHFWLAGNRLTWNYGDNQDDNHRFYCDEEKTFELSMDGNNYARKWLEGKETDYVNTLKKVVAVYYDFEELKESSTYLI